MKKRKSKFYFLLFMIFCAVISGCGTHNAYIHKRFENWEAKIPPDTGQIEHTVYLIGDAGDPKKNGQEPTFKLLKGLLKTDIGNLSSKRANQTVVFLGDNIYHKGLPKKTDSDRKEKEQRIIEQMELVKNFAGNVYFIPGNHDWDNAGRDGLTTVNRQEKFVENYLWEKGNVFLPDNGCPGPVELNINPNFTLILIDSQWWLHKYEKPKGPENRCHVNNELDFLVQLEDIIERNKNRHVMIAMHHPLFSNGNHGGHYSLKDYMFPLTLLRPNLYIPLPGIGSLYPFMRKYGVSRQDIPNPKYQKLKRGILSILEGKKNIVMVAGHDHNLQLRKHNEIYHIISGSGCRDKHAVPGNDAIFVHNTKGFVRLKYYANGEVWAEFWEPFGDKPGGKVTFRTALYGKPPVQEVCLRDEEVMFGDSTKTVRAGAQYKAGLLKEIFFGEHWRTVWSTPVNAPYLDICMESGGLRPVKKGGGQQTLSLHLIDDNNVQYMLRSVNKDPQKALPEGLRETFAEDIVQDQISSAHPYAALAIPLMEDTLGIYHTDPKLFYVPHTPMLGQYLDEFGGMLATLEIRPDEDLSNFQRFGYSTNVVSSRTMYRHLKEDNDHEVDQRMFLRSRFFDMLIGDWDRHEDQWRWAEFDKPGKGSVFKPVARDRDQVFFKFDGLLPWLMSRRWAFRHIRNFDYEIHDVRGLNLNAQHLDNTLLTKLTREDWLQIADSVRSSLTDDIIEKSVRGMPDSAFQVSGEEIIAKLKSRRDQLIDVAREYYEIVNEEANVIGSDKHEFFLIERLNDETTRVQVFKKYKEEEVVKKIFDRTFFAEETDEIRIYALGGNDSIHIQGKSKGDIKLKIIPGEGRDDVINNSQTTGWRKSTIIYQYIRNKDDHLNVDTITKGDGKIKTVGNPSKIYDTERGTKIVRYEQNYIGPRVSLEYNRDDGLYVGGGVNLRLLSFMKAPYHSTHTITGNYASNTNAYNFRYNGYFFSFPAKKYDLSIRSHAFGPKYVMNFFGLGNETRITDRSNIQLNRVNMDKIEITPALIRRFGEHIKLGAGVGYEYYDVEEKPLSRTLEALGVKNRSYKFGKAHFISRIDVTDNNEYPRRGLRWISSLDYLKELNNVPDEFTQLRSEFSFYTTPNFPFELTFAFRFGGATNIGEDFPFFKSNTLGGLENLRGFRRTRFSGKSSFYQNSEARLKASNFRNYLFTGQWGLLGFADIGRVWVVDDHSDQWHVGYGPGLWLNVYKIFLVSGTFGFSKEGHFVNVNFGMFF